MCVCGEGDLNKKQLILKVSQFIIHLISFQLTAEGKWVKLEKTSYMDPTGKTR